MKSTWYTDQVIDLSEKMIIKLMSILVNSKLHKQAELNKKDFHVFYIYLRYPQIR